MNREVLTTIGGLIVVGAVVVATFLYGNHQHQADLRHDQDVQRQQQAQQSEQKSASQQSGSSGSSQQPAVQKPSSDNQTALQGGQKSTATIQTSQPTPTETPKTGGSTSGIVGALAMAVAGELYRRSRKQIVQ